MRQKTSILVLIIILSLMAIQAGFAQETPPIDAGADTSQITDDEVNDIANQLYCPVCENIPLDTCGTAACDDWREEIRAMLASGMVEDDIIDNFVARFGDRVVSTPRTPILAAISIITPWVAFFLIAGFALFQLFRWTRNQDTNTTSLDNEDDKAKKRDSYLEQLEKDLAGK